MQQKTGYFMNYYLDGKPVEVDIVNDKDLAKHLDNITTAKDSKGESYPADFKQRFLDLKKSIESKGAKK